MNARSLLLGLLAVAAPFAVSCSSSSTTVTSGGAFFQFGGNGSCPDPNVQITIAAPGEDGQPKLIPDGADGARITCQVDGSHFNVVAGNAQGTLTAKGSLTNGQPSNVTMKFQVGNNAYAAAADACTLQILDNDGNKFRASFSCTEADAASLPGQQCSVASTSFFSFADCTGFD